MGQSTVNAYPACPERLQTTANVYANPNPLLDNVRRLLQECEDRVKRRARARQRKVNAAKASANREPPATMNGSANTPRRKRATTGSPMRTESDESAAPKSWTMRSQSAGPPTSETRRGRRPMSSRGNRGRPTAAYGTQLSSRLREEFVATEYGGQEEDYSAAGDESSLADEAIETEDAEFLIDEAVGTDVPEIPIHQAYRPHTAPAHRGQVVIQGDWSESEFGTPTESRSATRPPSAQPTLSTQVTFEEDPESLSSAVLGIAAPAATNSERESEKIPSIRDETAECIGA